MTAPVPSPDLTAIATRVMSNLLGQRWTWPRRRVVDTYRVPYQTRIIRLWGTPVSAVWSVKGPTGQLVEQAEWQLNNGNQIWFLQPQEWWWPGGLYDIAAPPPWFNMSWYGTRQPPGSRDITVDYAYGSPPPPDIDRAINQLAQQFALADACSPNCKLPERVTSVAREGISYTLIDPQDFLTQGRTGLYFVDLVIGSYGGKARSSIMSPELPPPRRISSVVVAS